MEISTPILTEHMQTQIVQQNNAEEEAGKVLLV
jgi:hypothetical protein